MPRDALQHLAFTTHRLHSTESNSKRISVRFLYDRIKAIELLAKMLGYLDPPKQQNDDEERAHRERVLALIKKRRTVAKID